MVFRYLQANWFHLFLTTFWLYLKINEQVWGRNKLFICIRKKYVHFVLKCKIILIKDTEKDNCKLTMTQTDYFLFIFPSPSIFPSLSLSLARYTYALHGRSIVWRCLPRGPGSASWPYQCWVMVVFPACNKSIRWHRMSAASRVGTPSMYPLAPAMVLGSALQSKEALCGQEAHIYSTHFQLITRTVHLFAWDQR